MSLSKYTTIILYKSAKHKQDKCRETRRELAQLKREKRLGAKLVKEFRGC